MSIITNLWAVHFGDILHEYMQSKCVYKLSIVLCYITFQVTLCDTHIGYVNTAEHPPSVSYYSVCVSHRSNLYIICIISLRIFVEVHALFNLLAWLGLFHSLLSIFSVLWRIWMLIELSFIVVADRMHIFFCMLKRKGLRDKQKLKWFQKLRIQKPILWWHWFAWRSQQ